MKKIILIVAGALLLVGASVGATLFLTGALSGGNVAPVATGEQPIAAVKMPVETHYFEFAPEFVVNFSGKSRARFFMAEVSVSTPNEDVLDILEKHNPELRNDLLMLFSNQDGGFISTSEGKLELRKQTLETVQKVVEKHYGAPSVSEVFFTRFVVQ